MVLPHRRRRPATGGGDFRMAPSPVAETIDALQRGPRRVNRADLYVDQPARQAQPADQILIDVGRYAGRTFRPSDPQRSIARERTPPTCNSPLERCRSFCEGDDHRRRVGHATGEARVCRQRIDELGKRGWGRRHTDALPGFYAELVAKRAPRICVASAVTPEPLQRRAAAPWRRTSASRSSRPVGACRSNSPH
jgi:hypothetical protein